MSTGTKNIIRRTSFALVLLSTGLFALALLSIAIGSVEIPLSEVLQILMGQPGTNDAYATIVLQARLPMIVMAILCGAALAVSGLVLQTLFFNPLAGPSILGISSGASLGVALVMLLGGGTLAFTATLSASGYIAILFGAFFGAGVMLAALLIFSSVVESGTILLIVGIMISYLTSGIVSILNSLASAEGIQSFVSWGFGSFSAVTAEQLPVPSVLIGCGILGAFLVCKPLNALLLGPKYAQNLGYNMLLLRTIMLLITGVLTATVTAFCGPIGFIGMVTPHVARLIIGTSNHRYLMPVTALMGAFIALLCGFISTANPSGIIPVNAITPVVGVPVIVYLLVNKRNISYFQ